MQVPLSLSQLIEIFRKVFRAASEQLLALQLQHQEGIGSRISAPTSPSQQHQQQQALRSPIVEDNDMHIAANIIQPLLDAVTATATAAQTPAPLPLGVNAPIPVTFPANAMANLLQLEREMMMNEDDYSKQSTEEQKSDLAPHLHHLGSSSSLVGAAVAVTVATSVSTITTNGTLPHNQSGSDMHL